MKWNVKEYREDEEFINEIREITRRKREFWWAMKCNVFFIVLGIALVAVGVFIGRYWF